MCKECISRKYMYVLNGSIDTKGPSVSKVSIKMMNWSIKCRRNPGFHAPNHCEDLRKDSQRSLYFPKDISLLSPYPLLSPNTSEILTVSYQTPARETFLLPITAYHVPLPSTTHQTPCFILLWQSSGEPRGLASHETNGRSSSC